MWYHNILDRVITAPDCIVDKTPNGCQIIIRQLWIILRLTTQTNLKLQSSYDKRVLSNCLSLTHFFRLSMLFIVKPDKDNIVPVPGRLRKQHSVQLATNPSRSSD